MTQQYLPETNHTILQDTLQGIASRLIRRNALEEQFADFWVRVCKQAKINVAEKAKEYATEAEACQDLTWQELFQVGRYLNEGFGKYLNHFVKYVGTVKVAEPREE